MTASPATADRIVRRLLMLAAAIAAAAGLAPGATRAFRIQRAAAATESRAAARLAAVEARGAELGELARQAAAVVASEVESQLAWPTGEAAGLPPGAGAESSGAALQAWLAERPALLGVYLMRPGEPVAGATVAEIDRQAVGALLAQPEALPPGPGMGEPLAAGHHRLALPLVAPAPEGSGWSGRVVLLVSWPQLADELERIAGAAAHPLTILDSRGRRLAGRPLAGPPGARLPPLLAQIAQFEPPGGLDYRGPGGECLVGRYAGVAGSGWTVAAVAPAAGGGG